MLLDESLALRKWHGWPKHIARFVKWTNSLYGINRWWLGYSSHALMMMTADCLPVVLGNALKSLTYMQDGEVWQVALYSYCYAKSSNLGMARCCEPCFEIGAEVKTAFCGKYWKQLLLMERHQINFMQIYCSLYFAKTWRETSFRWRPYQQQDEYFSYRRDAKTGQLLYLCSL